MVCKNLKIECVMFWPLSCSEAKPSTEGQQSFYEISELEKEKRLDKEGKGYKMELHPREDSNLVETRKGAVESNKAPVNQWEGQRQSRQLLGAGKNAPGGSREHVGMGKMWGGRRKVSW